LPNAGTEPVASRRVLYDVLPGWPACGLRRRKVLLLVAMELATEEPAWGLAPPSYKSAGERGAGVAVAAVAVGVFVQVLLVVAIPPRR